MNSTCYLIPSWGRRKSPPYYFKRKFKGEMQMKFSKELMIKRVTEAGLADLMTDEIRRIMDNLDGQHATTSCWERQVMGAPVLWVVGKDGTGQYVNEEDCV